MIKGLLGIKRTIIIFICIVTCFLSCAPNPSPRSVSISILEAETNYFSCDSLQKLAGYYPVRVYLLLTASNMSNDTLFLPIQKQFDTLMKSSIEFVGDVYGQCSKSWDGIIVPGDTIEKLFIVNLDNIPMSDIFTILHSFIRDIDISYNVVKSDTILSKYPMPDTVIFNFDRNIELKYRDIESLGDHIDWIL